MNELKEIRERALVDVRKIVKENIDRFLEAYGWLMRLEHKARFEGLLALEYEVGFIPKDMPLCKEIENMVRLVTDGVEPKFMAELMTLKFLSENYQGLDALLYFLYARGILLLQAGESSCIVEEMFNAVLPSDIIWFDRNYNIRIEEKRQKIADIKNLMSEKEQNCLKNISNHLSELTDTEWEVFVGIKGFYGFDKVVPYLDEKTQGLIKEHVNESRYYTIMQFPEIIQEEEIYQCEAELEAMLIAIRTKAEPTGLLSDVLYRSDEEMKMLIAELENDMIALALKGESEEISECFFRNMSLRLKYEIQDNMDYMGPVRMCDAVDAVRKIRQVSEEKLGWQWKEG